MPILDTTFIATIANGATDSAAVDMKSHTLVGINLPAAFTGVALTFKTSDTLAGTYKVIKDKDGNSVSKTVAQGTYVAIDPIDFVGVRFLKITSGSAEGGARTLTLSGRMM